MEMGKVNYINIINIFLISNLHTHLVGLEPMTSSFTHSYGGGGAG